MLLNICRRSLAPFYWYRCHDGDDRRSLFRQIGCDALDTRSHKKTEPSPIIAISMADSPYKNSRASRRLVCVW
jgi:hypothetical protein